MFRNFKNIFSGKQKAIQDEIALKSKTDEIISRFITEEVLKGANLDYQLSYTVGKGVIKIDTNNKLIAQEIALRIRSIEERLRKSGVIFKKLLV